MRETSGGWSGGGVCGTCDERLRAKWERSDSTQMQIMQFLIGHTGLFFPFRRYATISCLENLFAEGGTRIFLDLCAVFVMKNKCGYFVMFSQSKEARFSENILQIIFGNNRNTPTLTLLLVPGTLLSESYSPFKYLMQTCLYPFSHYRTLGQYLPSAMAGVVGLKHPCICGLE